MDRRQSLISVFAAISLIATTWLYGGHSPTTLCIALAGTFWTFLWLFLPTFEYGEAQSAKENLLRLLKFPPFWIGLLLFSYIGVQWAHPDLEAVRGTNSWCVFVNIDGVPAAGIPTSVKAPFGFDHDACTSPLRQLCILGNAWLLLCTLWCGLRSRKALKYLTLVFIVSALAAAMFGLYQQVMGTSYYLGKRTFHFGPFFYTNHAAEFFALNIALCAGTALRSWRESVLELRRGGIHLALVFFIFAFIIAAIATRSIGGSFAALAWIPLGLILIFLSNLLDKKSFLLFLGFTGIIAALGSFWFFNADLDSYFRKIDTKIVKHEIPDLSKITESAENPEAVPAGTKSVPAKKSSFFTIAQGDRRNLRRLSEKMFLYNPETGDWWQDHHRQIYGWGAGSYRWISPTFQKTMPELSYLDKKTGNRKIRTYANYAHCDIWNMLVEWGIVGTAIFLSGVVWFCGWALFNCRRWRVSSLAYLGGLAIFAAHGWVDFMIYSPFLLATSALLVVNFKLDLARAPAPQNNIPVRER